MNPTPPSLLRFAPALVEVERRADGALVLRSPQPLAPPARAVGEWLRHWAQAAPGRCFLAEREGAGWRRLGYADALQAVRRIAGALLARGLDAATPVVILSDNSIDHALLALAAMHVGVPVAPVSPAYSLLSRDHARLREIFALLRPGLVWTAEPGRYAAALAAVGATATPLAELLGSGVASDPAQEAAVDQAFARVGPDTVAKILFTSGSTGQPKGVVNTQRMLTANQQQLAQGWPFVEQRPPVVVDWLPWNHTFGGNHNFGMVLRNGGTLYIDGGKPAPGLIETTARNLREVSPTMYFNVPRGFDLLLPLLEADGELRRRFFAELDVLFYAAAALPQNLWQRIERLALQDKSGRLEMLSAWGSTETAPLATQVHFAIDRAGVIGLPVAGCEIKLVPVAAKLEARVRGPNVTPGYWQREDLTRAAFDDEGFYRIGDALKFADPTRPEQGLVFDGRVAEDFKLATGTWVHVGELRVRLIAAGNPLLQDAVITGHDGNEVGALLFLNPAAAQGLAAADTEARIEQALRTLAADSAGSSTQVRRALVLAEPPSIDAGEITDKGYLNQRALLATRAADVERLYAGGPGVVRV